MNPSHWSVTGDGAEDTTLTSYQVFSGIELVFKDIHSRFCDVSMTGSARSILEIEHCREGRTECQVGEDFFYLAPGDISIRHTDNAGRKANFPLSHYHGVSILIDLEKVPKCLSCLMEDMDVKTAALARKFELMEKPFFILRQNPSIEHIFSEIYNLPDTIRKGYLKVKVLDIAGEFGYANGSKFAGAFRSVMGVTPNQYRVGTEPESVRSEWSAGAEFANISMR